ncbi:MAG TPA: DMT family transporter [Caulobacteraceae bacterium]|nr:DMT family transporter [Caulobacteraceae bacterium]
MSALGRFTTAERAAIAAIILIWGINNIAAKVATNALPPLFVGGLRFAIALVFLAPFLRPPFDWRRLAPIMLFAGPLHFAAVYGGFALTSTVSAYVVSLQLWIPMTALAAWWILGERMPTAAIAGVAVAFVGVVWMTFDPAGGADPPAILVGLVGSAAWALATVLVRRSPSIRPLKLQALTSIAAAPALLGASALFERDVPARLTAAPPVFWVAMAWAGVVSTVVATGLLFWLVQRREAGRVTPYLLLTPIVSAGLGVVVLGERLSMQVVLGGAATLAGVAIVSLAERARSGTPPVAAVE